MESPLNKKIKRGEDRKAAPSKKVKEYKTLHEKVLSLVQESNASVREERRVTPRAALTVMNRALESLSSLSTESREAGALREVAVFISTATNTFSTNSTKHTDLLMQGHPLSALNASLTPAEYREKYAMWLSADSAINENVRSLVASAHMAEPGSVERDHAFSRLLVTKKFVPGYFKIDVLEAITAAFRDGNSSAARRARVALQWRDRKGRWVEMGRGINFQFRMPDGSIGTARGTYVGAGSPGRYDRAFGKTLTADTGLVEVRGDQNLPDGLYTITSGNATVFQARIPGEALRKAKIYDPQTRTYKDAYSADIPDVADIKAGFREAPLGWTKDDKPGEVSFSSDDNYNVIYDDGQYTLFRTDENGKPLDTPVGTGATWGEINDLIEKDSPSFDEQQEIIESGELPIGDAPIARIPRTRAQIEARYEIEQARKNNQGRLETNAKIEKIEKLIRTNKDLNGNSVPGWDPVVSSDGTYLMHTRNVGKGDATYPFIVQTQDGKYIFGTSEAWHTDKNGQAIKYDSWDEVEKAIPEFIPYLNRTFAKNNPIEYTPPQMTSERKPGIATQGETDPQNIEDVNKALDFLDKHMDEEGSTEDRAMGISQAQDHLKEAKKDLENGDIKSAISSLEDAFNLMDGLESPSEGIFPNGENSAEAVDVVNKLITRLQEADAPKPSGDKSLGKEIYERRIATGDSLDKVAKDLGLTRLEVRRLEAEYARSLEDNAPQSSERKPGIATQGEGGDSKTSSFSYGDAKKTALDSSKSAQERYAAVFDGAAGENLFEYLSKQNIDASDVNSSVPRDAEVVFTDGDGQNLTVRYPDGSYHYFDTGATTQDGFIFLENVNNFDSSVNDEFLGGLFKADGLPYYRGAFIDDKRQSDITSRAFSYDSAKKTALDSSNPAQERYAAIFDGATGRDFFEYTADSGVERSELDPSIPEGTEVVFADGDGQNLTLRYPDGTYHYLDTGATGENGLITADPVSAYDAEGVNDKVLKDLLDIDSLMYARGGFIDDSRQGEIARSSSGGSGSDEPPTPPSGGTPPKTPTPSQPSTPGLFNNFDVPNGAFQLRTVDYEPEGRVDEASTNFTDDPKKLATRFTPQDLVAALSEALVGTSDDAAIAEILNANVDDAGDIPGAEDMDGVDIPRANMGQPSGAGRLEFNAGEEYVPMEALYNAIWEAGLDPNRVIANIYDSVNGNNNNLNRLIEAQGGVRSPEEAQLVDDITAEIRQIKSASPDSVSSANKKDKPLPEEDPLPGQLIENVPINFENPDYYIPDSNAYIPSQPDVDENGFTDNPEILSRDYETADLIDQMIAGITDGSGAALLSFDDITVEVPVEALRDAIQLQDINTNDILLELKRESNDMSDDPGDLEDMIDNLGDPESDTSESRLQAHSQMIKDLIEQTGNTVDDDTADKIRDAINQEGLLDWSEADDAEIIEAITEVAGPDILRQPAQQPEPRRFPPTTGERQAIERPVNPLAPARPPRAYGPAPVNPPAPSGPFDSEGFNNISNLIRTTFPRGFTDDNKLVAVWESNSGNESMMLISRGEGTEPILFRWQEQAGLFSFTPQNTEDWFTGESARVLGWRAPSDEQQAALRSFVSNDNLAPDSADTPRDPSVDAPTPEAPETPEPPALVYPGPENRGYHPDNTTLDRTGKVMGKGTRIRASRDGRTGTVIAVQNIDNRTGERIPYVRVRFDDGTIAVRSALKVRATGDAVQAVPNREVPPTPPIPTNIGERLDAPVVNPGAVATDGSIAGVSNLGELPEALQGLGNPDATQTDFAAWGDRAGEIAFAGRNRVSLDNLRKLNVEWNLATLAATTLDGDERRSKRAEADEIKARLDKAIFDTFGVRDGVTFGNNGYTLDNRGISVSLTGRDEESITRDHVPMAFTVAMGIKDKDGRVLGTVNRTLSYVSRGDGTPGYWKVKNDYLNINNAGDKKSGFATAYNRYMEDWYIANGVKEIHVRAAGGGSFQGAFVWALNGFNWETPGEAESELMSRLQRMRRSANTDKERATIDRLLQKTNQARITGGGVDLDKAPTPMELALVGWYPGATNWLGKKFMTENSWSGIKRLDPAAKEQIQAINYDQIRRARSRIKDKLNRPGVSREFVLKANSDEFLANNQTLTPYIEEIRSAFQNNTSLATLSPAAKTALSRWVGDQIMAGDSRTIPLTDAFRLRTALDAEAAADNPRAGQTDFGVGNLLASADFEDISRNRLPGFTVRRLGTEESGYNDTYLVKHNDSGQIFYVKKDELAKQYRIDPLRAEIEAGMLTRALGFQGMYETRANIKDTSGEVLVMQQAGSSLPLASEPQTLSNVFENGGIQGPDGMVPVTRSTLLDSLRTPEDAIRIALLDLLINNQDRHNGNVLLAIDGTDPSRLRMLPIDHSLAQMAPSDTFNFEQVLSTYDNVYSNTIPVLLQRMGQDALIQAFRNEADKLVASLRSDAFSPSGNELRIIIDRYGSLNAYRDAIEARTAELLTPGTRNFEQFKDVLTASYWR